MVSSIVLTLARNGSHSGLRVSMVKLMHPMNLANAMRDAVDLNKASIDSS